MRAVWKVAGASELELLILRVPKPSIEFACLLFAPHVDVLKISVFSSDFVLVVKCFASCRQFVHCVNNFIHIGCASSNPLVFNLFLYVFNNILIDQPDWVLLSEPFLALESRSFLGWEAWHFGRARPGPFYTFAACSSHSQTLFQLLICCCLHRFGFCSFLRLDG